MLSLFDAACGDVVDRRRRSLLWQPQPGGLGAGAALLVAAASGIPAGMP